MGKLTFLLGGARSGKSSHAQKLAEQSGKSVTFIATAQALDDEMSTRIQKHQQDRPVHWETLEIPSGIVDQLDSLKTGVILLDCITLLVSNLMMQFVENDLVDEEKSMLAVQAEIDALLAYIPSHEQDWFIISNEVGLGLVPPYQMGRVYRDLLGWANQRLAREADEVLWMVAGIPVPIAQFS
ncbi:MAG: bifunctional adenosylcobinamide kinase/adenosylcobinamide-phosphate guanylyltransferase [Anaerolineales bacterium]|nr:bifunctional adenosylcobinamide kinase/adenosylcobinamide-phosphate guanylyltransferase [Anaerolineales bacterium]